MASLGLLLVVILAVIVSYSTPPFYAWIRDTPLERAGRWMVAFVGEQQARWHSRVVDAPLLADEKKAAEYLVEEIRRVRPTDAVVLRDGSVLMGRLHNPTPEQCEFSFEGDTGTRTLRFRDSDIQWQQRLPTPPVELSPRDVRFLIGLPGLRYYYLPPYLLAADVDYRKVRSAYEVLDALAAEFRSEFAVLLEREAADKLVYVCIFRNEEDYLRHAVEEQDADLERSVGFYSQLEDCLFVYDRLQSLDRTRIERQIAKMAETAMAVYGQAYAPQIERLAAAERERTRQLFQRDFVRTLRHEGTHQLAYSLGVHSAAGHETLWLPEGLAQYCETLPFGAEAPERLRILRTAAEQHRLIPWQDLLDTPTPRGFSYYGAREEVAYAQSWFLFRSLMDRPYRPRFLAYLDRVRCWRTEPPRRPQSEILAESLNTAFVPLARELGERLRAGAEPAAANSPPRTP